DNRLSCGNKVKPVCIQSIGALAVKLDRAVRHSHSVTVKNRTFILLAALLCGGAIARAAEPEKAVVQIIGFIQPPSFDAPWRFELVHRAGGSGFVIKTGKG